VGGPNTRKQIQDGGCRDGRYVKNCLHFMQLFNLLQQNLATHTPTLNAVDAWK